MALKTWDQYVREANRKPVTLRLPGGKTVKAEYFDGARATAFNIAQYQGKKHDALVALFGEKDGETVWDLLQGAPLGVYDRLIEDVLVEFGLREAAKEPADEKELAAESGKSETSSN